MLDILGYEFMQKGLITGVIIAMTCSFVGTFLVLRRYSLFGDGIAHVAFGGIAVGLFTGIFPFWTAFVVAIAGALGLQTLKQNANISGDAAVAIILTAGISIGIVLISASVGFTVDLFSFLFGNILLIGLDEMAFIIITCATAFIILLVIYRPLLHLTFNEEQAKVSGINTVFLNYLFVVLAAVIVVASMKLVGILLISALIVIPNITAMMFAKNFKMTVLISMSIAVTTVVVGLIASYYLSLAPSGTIVMCVLGVFLTALILKSRRVFEKNTVQNSIKTEERID